MIQCKSAPETIRLEVVRVVFVKRKLFVRHRRNIVFCLRKQNKNLLYQRNFTKIISIKILLPITNVSFFRKFIARKFSTEQFPSPNGELFCYCRSQVTSYAGNI